MGLIQGVHGVQGWLKVFSETRQRDDILSYKTWILLHNGQYHSKALRRGNLQGKRVLAWLDGVTSRDEAERWVGAEVFIERACLPELPNEGEYYWVDLIGCDVYNDLGLWLGAVAAMMETGANDVLVLDRDGREVLVPWVYGHTIVSVDVAQKRIVAAWDRDDAV